MQSQNQSLRYSVLLSAVGIVLAALTGGCHKDAKPVVPVVTDTADSVAVYTQLKPGNYWIYETWVVDSNGNGSPGYNTSPNNTDSSQPKFDSIYVEKDTVITGYTWHKVMTPDVPGSPHYYAAFLRDSGQYLVATFVPDASSYYGPYPDFAVNDFSTVFYIHDVVDAVGLGDTLIHNEVQMADKDKVVTVPAGTFATRALVISRTYYPYAMYNHPPYTRRQYTRYAAGIGMVSATIPGTMLYELYLERRLVRYHLD